MNIESQTGGNYSAPSKEKIWFTRRNTVFAAVSLAVMILLAYSNTFSASWHFDDKPNILERRALHLTSLGFDQIRQTFFDGDKLYRPVACLSLALNYYFGGENVTGYHVVNTTIHFIAAFFLYLLIRRIGMLPSINRKWVGKIHAVALLSAVLWALNPINTQAVTYIVQRMASMAAMFYVMAMYFYLRGRQTPSIKGAGGWFFLCALSGLLAVGSKENAVLLPLSLILMEFVLIKPPAALFTKKRIWISLAAIAGIAGVTLVIRGPAFFDPSWLQEGYEIRPFTLWERVLTQPRILIFYLTLIFYPMPGRLSICHDINISTGLLSPLDTIIAIFALAALAAAAILSRKKFPVFSFAVLFFFINHLVESTIFPLELIFEHRNYLPSMFLFVPIVASIYGSWNRLSNPRFMKFCISSGLTLLVIGFGSATHIRNYAWENYGTLWYDAMTKAPDLIRPRVNLGLFFYNIGRYDKVFEHNLAALNLRAIHRKNEIFLPHFNIGVEFHRIGNLGKALEHYRLSADYNDYYAATHNNLGVILEESGREKEAIEKFWKAVRYEPTDPSFWKNLGYALLRNGDVKESEAAFTKALELAPSDITANMGLGYIRRLQGLRGEAFRFFDRAATGPRVKPIVLLYLAENFVGRNMEEKLNTLIDRFVSTANEQVLKEYVEGVYPGEAGISQIQEIKESIYELVDLALRKKEAACTKRFRNLGKVLPLTEAHKSANDKVSF